MACEFTGVLKLGACVCVCVKGTQWVTKVLSGEGNGLTWLTRGDI